MGRVGDTYHGGRRVVELRTWWPSCTWWELHLVDVYLIP